MMSHRDINKRHLFFFKNANSGQKKTHFFVFSRTCEVFPKHPLFLRFLNTDAYHIARRVGAPDPIDGVYICPT